jgi:hypothetical protein
MLTLEQFKAKYPIGSSVGNPGTNTYIGECVSYVRRYIEEVHGVKTIINGNAINYYNSAFMAQHYDKVPRGQEQDGDILCWGDDAGSWTSEYGHIGISYGGRILNQNYNNSRRVSINDFFSEGYQGALRLKEVIVKPTRDQVLKQWSAFGKGTPSESQITYYTSHPWNVLNEDLLVYNRDERVRLEKLVQAKPTPLAKGIYEVK